ncbi:MAG: ABC transporter permease [Tannerellaceae bacterium]|nr:ABC transporter permease [Tannerellaceae bacterium]
MKTIVKNFLTTLKRFKVATVLNVLGLTVALAAFILIMIQLNYDRLYNQNIPAWDHIYRLEAVYSDGSGHGVPFSRPRAEMFYDISAHIQEGTYCHCYNSTIIAEIEQHGVPVMYSEPYKGVSPSFGKVFEFDMVEGSSSCLEEPSQILIPRSMAEKLFGTGSAIGNRMKVYDSQWIVGGVYKDFPANSSLKNAIYKSLGDENNGSWNNQNYTVYLKLDHPSSAGEVVENYRMKYEEAGGTDSDNRFYQGMVRLTPFKDLHYIKNVDFDNEEKTSRSTLLVLTGIAFILLIIAAINYTNFSMALTPMRVKSINTQKVMGADTQMLKRALLAETFTICLISYLLAVCLIFLFSHTSLVTLIDGGVHLNEHTLLLLYTLAITLLIALFAGLYPAHYVTSFPPALVLKGNFGLSPKGRFLRNGLICFQFVSSFGLIIAAAFMVLQNHFMQNTPLGYDSDHLLVATINDKVNTNRDALANEIKSVAGVKDVAYSQFLLSSSDQYMGWGREFRDSYINFQCLPVLPNFLDVMGIEVQEGRNFREDDRLTAHGALIFNEEARRKYDLELGERINEMEIIGFIYDIKFASFRQEMSPMAFFVWGTRNWGDYYQTLYVQMEPHANYREIMRHVRSTLDSFDPGYPFTVRFFDEVLQKLYEKEGRITLLITLFSLVAIFISIVGVFGLVIFESQYKLKEIGLRKVMGSTTTEILILFNKIYIRILIGCFVVAAPVAYLLVTNWLENFAYRTPLHWWVFAGAFLAISLLTILTVTFQNRRAAYTNPVESIKAE